LNKDPNLLSKLKGIPVEFAEKALVTAQAITDFDTYQTWKESAGFAVAAIFVEGTTTYNPYKYKLYTDSKQAKTNNGIEVKKEGIMRAKAAMNLFYPSLSYASVKDIFTKLWKNTHRSAEVTTKEDRTKERTATTSS
jgi:hypothetical protein